MIVLGENGWNLRSANYGANSLNQYTNRDVPGYVDNVDIMGLSFAIFRLSFPCRQFL